jgi:hypothetical protein
LIGLIIRRGRKITLTDNGKYFLELNSQRLYDLELDQKRLLIRTCYLHGPFRLRTLALIKKFSPSYEEKTFSYTTAGELAEDDFWLIEHLVQLDLVIRGDSYLKINKEYVDTIASFISEGKGWTEESLSEYLKERREIGEFAENLIEIFERKRLKKSNCGVESASVRRISKLKVDAGYDIESFDGKSKNLDYDRFVEVKGAKDSKVRFFWSENEMKVAKKLGKRYWIYFQGGINLKTGLSKNEPLMFRNPIETILKDKRFTISPQGILVEANLTGKKT